MSSSSKRSFRSPNSPPPTPESSPPPVSEATTPVSESTPTVTEVEETTLPAPPSPDVAIDSEESDSLETSAASSTISRLMPIPPPSEPRQYRAIGLVRGQYAPSVDQITRGALMASSDGTPINAVLLGRVMSLVKNHIDLQQTHLWVVYPRTGQHDGNLHVQIVGVWEPETLNEANDTSDPNSDPNGEGTDSTVQAVPESILDVEDNYFSVRGEAIFADRQQGYLVIKIKQAPRKAGDKMKFFKLKLMGNLPGKPVGHFWEFHVCRKGNDLVIQECHDMGALPVRKPVRGGGQRFDRSKKPGYSPQNKPSHPSRSDSGERRSSPPPPKPIPRKRQESSQTSVPKKILPSDRSSS
ncbi:MAG: hypothetical protein WBD58_13660 [Geitlerinemataceae cyanobacterium]